MFRWASKYVTFRLTAIILSEVWTSERFRTYTSSSQMCTLRVKINSASDQRTLFPMLTLQLVFCFYSSTGMLWWTLLLFYSQLLFSDIQDVWKVSDRKLVKQSFKDSPFFNNEEDGKYNRINLATGSEEAQRSFNSAEPENKYLPQMQTTV